MIVENYVIYFMIKVYSTICTSVNILLRVSLVLEAFLRLGIFHPFPPECAGKLLCNCGIVGPMSASQLRPVGWSDSPVWLSAPPSHSHLFSSSVIRRHLPPPLK